MRGQRTESQEHRHSNQPRDRGEKRVRLELTSCPFAERGRGLAHTGRKKETKQQKEKHVRLEGGGKPGPVNLFLRISSCHLKYCQWRSFWSSSEGSSTPTLGSRRRERECDGEHRGPGALGTGPGPCPSRIRQAHAEERSVPSLQLSPFSKTQRGREATTFKFKATMLGARPNEDPWGMKVSLSKYNVRKSEEYVQLTEDEFIQFSRNSPVS